MQPEPRSLANNAVPTYDPQSFHYGHHVYVLFGKIVTNYNKSCFYQPTNQISGWEAAMKVSTQDRRNTFDVDVHVQCTWSVRELYK